MTTARDGSKRSAVWKAKLTWERYMLSFGPVVGERRIGTPSNLIASREWEAALIFEKWLLVEG
jgi:hypothetical protein